MESRVPDDIDSSSQILSDSEDWVGFETQSSVQAAGHDACNGQQGSSNSFLRRGKPAGPRVAARSDFSRKLFIGHPKCMEKQSEIDQPNDNDKRSPWDIDITQHAYQRVNSQGQTKRVTAPSFLDKPIKALKQTFDPSSPRNANRANSAQDKIAIDENEFAEKPSRQVTTLNTRDDGATVITASYKKVEQSNYSKKVKDDIGWGKNFVRINLKVCLWFLLYPLSQDNSSSSQIMSMQNNNKKLGKVKGASKFRRKKSKWRVEPLRQVGDGSGYMHGWDKSNSSFQCFKCGQPGHFASACTGQIELEASDPDDEEFENIRKNSNVELESINKESMQEQPTSGPLCEWQHTADLYRLLKEKFGHASFRGNQLETILEILGGRSCLNIMPTGMGKSLCYQLPAFLLPQPVVVISPLIALMQDQCAAAPAELNAAILWSGQTPQKALEILNDLKSGKIRLLFISPERVSNEHFLESIQPWLPLQLLVIDEAHCIAEWGHSFRPSYYRLSKVIRSDLPSNAILALTATATLTTESCIREALGIPGENRFRHGGMHENLNLQVQKEDNYASVSERWQNIAKKLQGTLNSARRAIVYCSFRKDADNLARALVISGIRAKSYHSGVYVSEREKILGGFVKGTIKVVVATTAFGMGINVQSVDAVIHVSMPRSLEEYVQQIGRAGRSGEIAECICFLSANDYLTLRSLSSNPYISQDTVETVLQLIFSQSRKGDYKTIDLSKIQQGKIPEETIESMICYLEKKSSSIRFFGTVPLKARISFYAMQAHEMTDSSTVSSILKACPRPRQGVYHVDVGRLCTELGLSPAKAFQELSAMSRQSLIGFQTSKEKGICVRIDTDLKPRDINKLVEEVLNWLSSMNTMIIDKLDAAYRTFQAASLLDTAQQGDALRSIVTKYFEKTTEEFESCLSSFLSSNKLESKVDDPVKKGGPETLLAAKAVLRQAKENGISDMSAIEISSILHGISSGIDNKRLQGIMGVFWGRLLQIDHRDVHKAAEEAIKMGEESA